MENGQWRPESVRVHIHPADPILTDLRHLSDPAFSSYCSRQFFAILHDGKDELVSSNKRAARDRFTFEGASPLMPYLIAKEPQRHSL